MLSKKAFRSARWISQSRPRLVALSRPEWHQWRTQRLDLPVSCAAMVVVNRQSEAFPSVPTNFVPLAAKPESRAEKFNASKKACFGASEILYRSRTSPLILA